MYCLKRETDLYKDQYDMEQDVTSAKIDTETEESVKFQV